MVCQAHRQVAGLVRLRRHVSPPSHICFQWVFCARLHLHVAQHLRTKFECLDKEVSMARSSHATKTRGILTVEWAFIGDIINKKYTHRSSVICRRNRSEALLTSCIPYLEFYPLTVQLNCPNFEVDANGGNERWSERIFAESQKTARFSNSRITNQQQFDLWHWRQHLVNRINRRGSKLTRKS